jgi:hypothetical protein
LNFEARFSGLRLWHKKVENHAWMLAIHYLHCNFCRIHKSLRVTPAMAAGVTAKLWEIADIVALLNAK